jgi:hypothetical protein
MGCDLELFQSLNGEFIMKAPRRYSSDSGHRSQQCDGIAFSAQPFEHRQTPCHYQLMNEAGERLANSRELLQTLDAFGSDNLIDRSFQTPEHRRGSSVGADPKNICTLLFEYARDFVEPRCRK